MTALNHENIEFWMFQHHEGLLSKDESDELLKFIEDHPEYKQDFKLWEKSKLMPDASVVNELEDSILKTHEVLLTKGATVSFWIKYRLIIGLIGFSTLALILWWNLSDDGAELKKPELQVKNANEVINEQATPEQESLDEKSTFLSRETEPDSTVQAIIKTSKNRERVSPKRNSLQENLDAKTKVSSLEQERTQTEEENLSAPTLKEDISDSVSNEAKEEENKVTTENLVEQEQMGEQPVKAQGKVLKTQVVDSVKTIAPDENTEKVEPLRKRNKVKRSARFELDNDDF